MKAFIALVLLACVAACSSQPPPNAPAKPSKGIKVRWRDTEGNGWSSSGGGDLRTDEHNPWFLKNTKTVKYCIALDRQNFSAPEETVGALIERAIAYWQREFEFPNLVFEKSPSFAAVGTQKFQRLAKCDGSEDLAFQFGYGTLAPEQLEYLSSGSKPFNKIVATTIRTSYDREELRGRGFMYIASDSGPHAYSTEHDLKPEAWQHPELLHRVIAHELGHVFGLPHIGDNLMLESAVEDTLSPGHWQDTITAGYDLGPFFLSLDHSSSDCLRSSEQRAFFGATPEMKCLHLHPDLKKSEILIYGSESMDSEKKLLGSFVDEPKQDPENKQNVEIDFRPGIYVRLPVGQKVFSEKEAGNGLVQGPSFFFQSLRGRFRLLNGETKAAFVRFEPSSHQVIGSEGDVIRINYQAYPGRRMHIAL